MPAVGVKVQMFVATAEEWARPHEILEENWIGIESDTGLMKLGDGSSRWIDLDYINQGDGGGGGGDGDLSGVNSPTAAEWAKFTSATELEGRTNAELISDLGLGAINALTLWQNDADSPTLAGQAMVSPVSISNYELPNVLGNYTTNALYWSTLQVTTELNSTRTGSAFLYGIYNFFNPGGTYTSGEVAGIHNFVTNQHNDVNTNGTVKGLNSIVHVESPCAAAIAGYFGVTRGDANTSPILTGIETDVRSGYTNTDELTGAHIQIGTVSTGSTIALARGIIVRNFSAGSTPHTYTDLRGISLDGWENFPGSTATTSYGIYADTTIDIGATRYFIYSLSTSPSVFSGDVTVPAEAYGVGWNGSNEVPTKNDLYDKIETVIAGGMTVGGDVSGANEGHVLFVDSADDLEVDDNFTYTPADGLGVGVSLGNVQAKIDVFSTGGYALLKLAGSNTGTSGTSGISADPVLDIIGPNGQNSNGTSSGNAGGTGSAVYIETGGGGTQSGIPVSGSTRGGDAGDMEFYTGSGGTGTAASGDNRGGAGGDITIDCGNGGGATGGAAGAAGHLTLGAGTGGTSTNAAGGAGGIVSITAGAGGSVGASSSSAAGAAGSFSIQAGAGGSGSSGSGTASNGGAVNIFGGSGGSKSTSGTSGNGGNINIYPGAFGSATSGASAGVRGDVNIGNNVVARNVNLGGNGSNVNVGQHASALVGFFNVTAVARQSGTGETTGFTAGAGTNVTDESTFTGNVGSTAYRINDIVKALKNYGLLAT